MGADQSKPSNVDADEKLRERLQAFRMNENRAVSEKDGFVHVGDARTWVSARLRT
jgi:bleomycin hydrolase